MTPTLICDYANKCGENPYWHPTEKVVYWTDIPSACLYRYDPATGKHGLCYQDRVVGGFTVEADGALLLFMDKGTVRTWRNGQYGRTILDHVPEEIEGRFNDVIADPEGRVFCGTAPIGGPDGKPKRLGKLYRLDRDGSIHLLDEGFGFPNGMGFTGDLSKLYFCDSPGHKIYVYDYDRATGAITNRKVFLDVPADGEEGLPDGMTVDAQDNLWSARWDGSRLVQLGPDARVKQQISFPVKKVSSVIFGDDDLGTMYCTTAGGANKATQGAHAGGLFKVRVPGVTGRPEFPSRIA